MLRNILFAIDGIKGINGTESAEAAKLCRQLSLTMAELIAEWQQKAGQDGGGSAGQGSEGEAVRKTVEGTGQGNVGFVRAVLPEELWLHMQEWNLQIDDTVVITDDAETAAEVRGKKGAVVAVLTEQNRGASFGEIPFAVDGFFNPGLDYFQKVYERCHGIPWTILQTERCIVREVRVEDLERLYEIYAEPSITRYMEGLYENREDERRYTEAYIRNMYGFYGYGIWIVEEKETGRIIGRAGLENRGGGETELGYMLAKEAQGKGIAYEVCRAILDYAADALEMEELVCYVRAGNEASVRLCERLGFRRREEREIEGKQYQIFSKKLSERSAAE